MKKSKRYSAKSVQSIFILVLSCYLENAEIVFIFVNAATAAYFWNSFGNADNRLQKNLKIFDKTLFIKVWQTDFN